MLAGMFNNLVPGAPQTKILGLQFTCTVMGLLFIATVEIIRV